MQGDLTHFDKKGNAIMVDVSDKQITNRVAAATGTIYVDKQIINAIKEKQVAKGDVLGVATVAGIMGAKQTSSLIPMCHTLVLDKCGVEFSIDEDENSITAVCTVKCTGKTGVEMEALSGVSTALLTIYDMCKAISKKMRIDNIHLLSKSGGKSGDFYFDD